MNWLYKLRIQKTLIMALVIHMAIASMAFSQSLWHDEAITGKVAKMGWVNYYREFAGSDFHPPLHYLTVMLSTSMVGMSDFGIRLPSLLFSLMTIVVVYFIAKHYKRDAADMAAILVAVSPLPFYYATEARMYSMAMFLVALGILSYIKLGSELGRYFRWLFTLSLTLAFMTHYLTLLMIPVFVSDALIRNDKERRKDVAYLIGLIVLSLTPLLIWSPVLARQLVTASGIDSVWGNLLGQTSIKNVALIPVKFIIGRISIGNPFLYGTVAVFLTYFYVYVVGKNKDLLYKHRLIFIWLVAPVVAAIGIGFFVPILTYFRLLFIAPAISILLALGLTSIKGKYKQILFTFLVLSINVYCVNVYVTMEKYHREQWKQAVTQVDAIIDGAKDGSVVLFTSGQPSDAWAWYSRHVQMARGMRKDLTIKQQIEPIMTAQQIVVFDYLADIYDRERKLLTQIEDMGFEIQSELQFSGVGSVFVFGRDRSVASLFDVEW